MRVGGSHPPLSSPIWEGCRADCCDVVRETMTRSHLGTATRSTGLPLNCTTLCSAHSPITSADCVHRVRIILTNPVSTSSSSASSTSSSSSHLHIFLLPFPFPFHPPRRNDEFLAVLVISVTTGAEGEARRGAGRQHTDKADGSCDASLVLQYYWRLPESDSVHVACRMGL